ncbi:MAG TPA: hypothetical protein VHN99_04245 [Deinococcales bacterium]|nr:hypothetical protein [Deinococcales bacterium]
MSKPAPSAKPNRPDRPARPEGGRGAPAKGAAAPDAKSGKGRRVALEPVIITEKILVRSRPDKAYFSVIDPAKRTLWDKKVGRVRFIKPSKTETAATKAVEGALLEFLFPLRLGGMFQMRYDLIRQPLGFQLNAVRGSFGVLAGLAEAWQFVQNKGATEVQLTRSLAPRFKPLRGWVEDQHRKAMRATLEGLKKYVETPAK